MKAPHRVLACWCLLAAVAAPARADPPTVLHQFNLIPDVGIMPQTVTLDRDGMLYGTTGAGGTGTGCSSAAGPDTGCGTVFSMDAEGQVRDLADFSNDFLVSRVSVRGGMLRGTTGAAVYAMHTDGSVFKLLHVFSPGEPGPTGDIAVDPQGVIYGTTGSGTLPSGRVRRSMLYRLMPDGTFTVLHTFDAGEYTQGVIADDAGNLFGATLSPPPADRCGTVFEFQPTAGALTIIQRYRSPDCFPQVAAVDHKGSIYGFTNSITASYASSIFRLQQTQEGWRSRTLWQSGATNTLIDGISANGADSLIGVSEQLSATGGPNPGALFSLVDGTMATLATFTSIASGTNPSGAPVQRPSGEILGATRAGGDGSCGFASLPGCGTIFGDMP